MYNNKNFIRIQKYHDWRTQSRIRMGYLVSPYASNDFWGVYGQILDYSNFEVKFLFWKRS